MYGVVWREQGAEAAVATADEESNGDEGSKGRRQRSECGSDGGGAEANERDAAKNVEGAAAAAGGGWERG